ncbi:MAG: peptidase Ste24p [Betaproteobacteria bacterium]|jgi:predicted Zn-dependent protease|nr:peptidase Ste24p [Betaproteobacteria bacterium]MEA3153948.1 beta-barrel assembly-enhancing protease [Betaproteobacteria bacterium]
MLRRYFILLLLGLVPRALAEGLPELGDAAQSSFTALEERRLGEEVIREIRADRSYYDDVEATDYINALGQRLVSRGSDSRQDFEFFLINERSINAFALPGGFVGVHTGLILAAQSESELASVIAHEIAHVTQRHIARIIAQQKQSAVMSLAALAVAILAARSSPDVASAATAFGQAGAIQNLLNFTRDHEREADRVGLQILEGAGYDPRSMAMFFERLQRATRIYDIGGAPSYLRTHPVTYERIADIQNRLERLPYRQITDSTDFQLVRAKLRADTDTPAEARAFFEQSLTERRFLSEAASRYGLAISLVRQKDHSHARKEYEALRRTAGAHPMVESLGCRIKAAAGETESALTCYRDALRAYSNHRALTYDYAELLLHAGRAEPALAVISQRLQFFSEEPKLYLLQGRAYALQGKAMAQHRATGEAYARMGNVRGAIEQMQIALRSGDGDFYQLSAVEARLKDLRKIDDAQRREQRR